MNKVFKVNLRRSLDGLEGNVVGTGEWHLLTNIEDFRRLGSAHIPYSRSPKFSGSPQKYMAEVRRFIKKYPTVAGLKIPLSVEREAMRKLERYEKTTGTKAPDAVVQTIRVNIDTILRIKEMFVGVCDVAGERSHG
jgi:hypothetical protein